MATDTSPEGVSGRVVKIQAEPQNGVFGWQSIINQDLLNDFRIGYNGARTRINGQAPTVGGLDFSAVSLNISGNVANLRHRRAGRQHGHLDPRRLGARQQRDQWARPAIHAVFIFLYRQPELDARETQH